MSPASPAGLLGRGWAGCVPAALLGVQCHQLRCSFGEQKAQIWASTAPWQQLWLWRGSAEAAGCSGVGEEGGAALGEQLAQHRVPAGNPLGAPVCISVLPWWVQQTHWWASQ